ncbi:hypothetical protein BDW59DRAFT_159115 [Aspergillus cavernicola]|uniref:Uncharacterized protein n=1 Tax=Aspergillus cavernicola TaxID=176166 RepID=A0ABR4IQL9_9EURO
MLLDRGAASCINEPYESYLHHFITPFTAAMYQQGYDWVPLLNRLLRAGALIHGPEIEAPVKKPTHIPVFIAVEAMATTGTSRYWTGACITGPTSITTPQLKITTSSGCSSIHIKGESSKGMEKVENPGKEEWGEKERKKIQSPLQGLSHLLDQGANIDSGLSGYNQQLRRKNGLVYLDSMSPWCLERLLRKWGLAKLRECSNYSTMVEYLLHRSVQRGDIAEMLVRCEFALRADYHTWAQRRYNVQSEKTVRFWVEFVDNYLLQRYRLSPTGILAGYIYNALERGDQVIWFSRQRTVRRDRLDFVRYPLSKGADASFTAQGSTARDLLVANVRYDGNSGEVHTSILSADTLGT